MTRAEFVSRFPQASESLIRANASEAAPVNENKTHPQLQRSKRPKQARALAADHEGKTQCSGCPAVRFTLRRIQFLDIDAKYGSIKDLLDGLQYAGLIHGDKEGQITLEVNQVKVRHRSDEKTDIEVDFVKKFCA